MKVISVWLILKDKSNKTKIILQRRAKKDAGKIQSFPFVVQATVSGKIETKETIKQAVLRETKEELGPNFKLPKLSLFCKEKFRLKNKNALSYNFKGKISENNLKKIKLHSGALPQLKFISKEDLPKLKPFSKDVNPKNELILFPDQLKALRKLLKKP